MRAGDGIRRPRGSPCRAGSDLMEALEGPGRNLGRDGPTEGGLSRWWLRP